MVRVVRASWVLPGEGEAIADGAVALDASGLVLDVGPASEVLAACAAAGAHAVVESHAAVVFPGLVNAHTHIELSFLRGRVAGGAGFVPWVGSLVKQRREADADEVRDAIERGCDELLACGTAAVGDVCNTGDTGAPLAARGIRGWLFHEVSGVGDDGGEASLAQALAWAATPPAPLRAAVALHALYTTRASLARRIAHAARAGGAVLSLHLAEHPAERAFLRDRGGPLAEALARTALDFAELATGDSPVAVADALGLLAPDLLAVHLADARREELDRVAASGARAVLCPRSNLYIQTLLPPLHAVLAAGLRPALGTDSLASNTSLDVMAEAAALRARFPSVPTRTLFAMATAWGADALALDDLGRIARGKRPGLVSVPAPDPARVTDPFAYAIASAPSARRWVSPAHVRESAVPQ